MPQAQIISFDVLQDSITPDDPALERCLLEELKRLKRFRLYFTCVHAHSALMADSLTDLMSVK